MLRSRKILWIALSLGALVGSVLALVGAGGAPFCPPGGCTP